MSTVVGDQGNRAAPKCYVVVGEDVGGPCRIELVDVDGIQVDASAETIVKMKM